MSITCEICGKEVYASVLPIGDKYACYTCWQKHQMFIDLVRKSELEDKYISEEYETTTLYFIAPRELVSEKHPKAESAEISIEFPTNNPEPSYATVMLSPTMDGVDYDWTDYELPYDIVEMLMKKEKENDSTRRLLHR